jgi:hypothetical protein
VAGKKIGFARLAASFSTSCGLPQPSTSQGHVRIPTEIQVKENNMKRNIMNRNVASTALVIVFAATLVLSFTATAQAGGPACSLARAAGTYGFSDSGTVVGVGPRVAAGIFSLDKAGNLLNGKATSSLNGTIAEETFSGTYTVNSDCTGTFNNIELRDLSGNLLLTITANLAWDDNMKQLRAIFTSAKLPDGTSLLTVISADARKMVP